MRDLGIAERLRRKGLHVVEVDGWKTRGSSTFAPRGSVDHHTAGGPAGDAPSLGVCIGGRADLPGPLCNVLVGRTNTVYVVAAGRANHAGRGGWRGLAGNSAVWGVERENVGDPQREPWRADQLDTAARVHAALIEGCERPDPALVCEHREWAPGRKVDAHTVDGEWMRTMVAAWLHRPADTGGEEEDMPAKPIVAASRPNEQWIVIGDNLVPVGSTDELGYYQRAGLVRVGPPEVWPDAYFDALRQRLNVLDR